MKFFIDTAKLSEIKEANDLGILDGVTTNPSLMAKEGITGHQNIINHYVEICNIVDGPVSAEVIAADFKGMVSEGEALARVHKNIVVKIPMTKEGIKAIKYFHTKNIKTNCTLVFSSGQALLAAKAGATYLSPFLGRLDDISSSGIDLISQIRLIYDNYAFKTQILAASIFVFIPPLPNFVIPLIFIFLVSLFKSLIILINLASLYILGFFVKSPSTSDNNIKVSALVI